MKIVTQLFRLSIFISLFHTIVWGFSLPHSKIIKKQLYTSKTSCLDEQETLSFSYEIKKDDDKVCPPSTLRSLPLGKEIFPLQSLPDLSITKLSLDPPLFLMKNFLSTPDEQIAMIMTAVHQGMHYSGTSSGDLVSQRFKSYTSWVYPEGASDGSNLEYDNTIDDQDGDGFENDGRTVAKFMTELSSFLFFPEYFANGDTNQKPHQSTAEPVQVVRYEVGGKYDMHHDGYNRFLTVLCYLNGIAGTWFPYAIVDEKEHNKTKHERYQDIPDFTMETVGKDKTPGKDGILVVGSEYEFEDGSIYDNPNIVKVNPGDAIAFYSYDWIETKNNDSNGRLDSSPPNPDQSPPTGPFMNFRSLHTGMTATKKEKWIATNWFRLNDDDKDMLS